MTNEKIIKVKLTEEFNILLDKWIQELQEVGIKKSKSELLIYFAMIGFIQNKRKKKK